MVLINIYVRDAPLDVQCASGRKNDEDDEGVFVVARDGWESGMDETIGKPFVVGVVSRAYRMSPVVGLSVPNGLVAIAGGRFPTYGWYFPLEALEHG